MYVAMNQKWAIEHIQLCQQGRYPANIVRIDSLFHTIIYKRWAVNSKCINVLEVMEIFVFKVSSKGSS